MPWNSVSSTLCFLDSLCGGQIKTVITIRLYIVTKIRGKKEEGGRKKRANCHILGILSMNYMKSVL